MNIKVVTEAKIQSQIIAHLEKKGYYVVKIIQTNKNGWPDLQALKNGKIVFIEVKKDKGKVSELQKYRHKELSNFGFKTIIAHNINELDNELASI
jgi:Holliday junction resolvase